MDTIIWQSQSSGNYLNKIILLFSIYFIGLVVGGLLLADYIHNMGYAEPTAKEIQIPSWVKHSAGWWSEDRISDQDYLKSIQYLIDQGIIKIK